MSSLAITLNAAGVQVMPGQAASFGVEVRNLGTVVDRYRCEIVGMDPAWVTVSPASLELFPARELDERSRADAPPTVGRFSVALHPPRSAAALAGAWPIGAKVASEHDPANRLVEEATITILPFGALDADLRPALMGGRFGANTVVHLTNAGNRPEAVTISGTDRAERIDFRIDKPILNLGPGETVNVKLRLSGGDVKLVGGADTRPFTLDVKAAAYDTPPVTLSGTYERKAIVPTGLPVALATILALGMGGLAIKQAFFRSSGRLRRLRPPASPRTAGRPPPAARQPRSTRRRRLPRPRPTRSGRHGPRSTARRRWRLERPSRRSCREPTMSTCSRPARTGRSFPASRMPAGPGTPGSRSVAAL